MEKLIILFVCMITLTSHSINPLAGNTDSINAGKNLYKQRCSNCHGTSANGKDNGFFMSPSLRKFNRGYLGFIDTLTNGYGRMPAWGGMSKLSSSQLNELASYLESISIESSNWK